MGDPDKFERAERRWQEWQPRSYGLGDRFLPRIVRMLRNPLATGRPFCSLKARSSFPRSIRA